MLLLNPILIRRKKKDQSRFTKRISPFKDPRLIQPGVSLFLSWLRRTRGNCISHRKVPDYPLETHLENTARRIVQRLGEAGFIAYFAGGCVRDKLLGNPPKDYDIATSATPEEVLKVFPRTYAVGAHFGVIVVHEDGENFEVATFRSDGAYLDGRRPEAVVFSSPEMDTQRRDFTINGMFYDPLEEKVIDFVGGEDDLRKRVIQAIGRPRERFEEDKLRILRAIRFAARFDFQIEEDTWAAVKEFAPRITQVSMERIRDELVKTLTHASRKRGFDLLDQADLWTHVIPEINAMKGCDQPPQFHPEGDVFEHTRIMLGLLPSEVSAPLAFATLLHDIAKPVTHSIDETGRIRFNNHDHIGARMTRDIMRRLKFSNDEIEAAVEMVDKHMVFKDVKKMRIAKLKRFMARDTFDQEMELHRVDCQSSHGLLDNYDFLHAKEEEFASEPLVPEPLITGTDLIQELGWNPGPKFKEVLEAVGDLQLEGTLTSRDQALEYVRQNYA